MHLWDRGCRRKPPLQAAFPTPIAHVTVLMLKRKHDLIVCSNVPACRVWWIYIWIIGLSLRISLTEKGVLGVIHVLRWYNVFCECREYLSGEFSRVPAGGAHDKDIQKQVGRARPNGTRRDQRLASVFDRLSVPSHSRASQSNIGRALRPFLRVSTAERVVATTHIHPLRLSCVESWMILGDFVYFDFGTRSGPRLPSGRRYVRTSFVDFVSRLLACVASCVRCVPMITDRCKS